MNQISSQYSHISFNELFVCTNTHIVVVSKTIPTITMKLTDQNGLSLSSLLTPIVPLLSLSLSVCAVLSSVFFYYRMYAQSLNTITPTNKRVMWKKDGQENNNRYYFDISLIDLHFLMIIFLVSKKKKTSRPRQCISSIQTINFIDLSVAFVVHRGERQRETCGHWRDIRRYNRATTV